jgi:hypothetical protein
MDQMNRRSLLKFIPAVAAGAAIPAAAMAVAQEPKRNVVGPQLLEVKCDGAWFNLSEQDAAELDKMVHFFMDAALCFSSILELVDTHAVLTVELLTL